MKINEVTEADRSSIYDPDANKFKAERVLGRQITNSIEPSSGVKWPDDELWNKANMLGAMLSELPSDRARTPGEALKKAGITSKDELAEIIAKAKEARAVAMPEPEEPADEPEDDDIDSAPDDDEIARQADMRARGR